MAKPFVYWDSCVFIDWMNPAVRSDRLAAMKEVVAAVQSDRVLIVTSALSLSEVVRLKSGPVIPSEDEEKIVRFFKNHFLEVRPLDRRIAEISRQLQRAASVQALPLPVRDSIHLATAIHAKAVSLHTFDEKHLIPHNLKHGDPPLEICWPHFDGDPGVP